MNVTAKVGLASVVGLVVGAGILYSIFRPHGSNPSCANAFPDGTSTVYGIDLTDGKQLAMAVIHYYPPGGFKHNVAILEQGLLTNDGNAPALYNLGSCSGSAATITMTDDSNKTLSTWTFGPGSTSTTYTVTVTPAGSSGYPATTMSGTAYLMQP